MVLTVSNTRGILSLQICNACPTWCCAVFLCHVELRGLVHFISHCALSDGWISTPVLSYIL